MDRIQWQRLGDAVRNYLLTHWSREVFVFAFFFLVSSGFWLIQTLNDAYDMDIQVPIELTGVPSDMIVTDELPSPLRVTIHDKGTNLLRYYRTSGRPPIQVNFRSHVRSGDSGRVVLSQADIQKMLSTYLLGSSQLVSIHPDTIDFFYGRGEQKRVPIRLQGHIAANPLFYITEMNFTPDSVTVWAPASILDTITAVQTEMTEVADLTQNENRILKLAHVKGQKIIPSQVQLSVAVDMYTEKSVSVPIQGLNFPGDQQLITFPSRATISFRVGTKQYKDITGEDFVVAVTYEELIQNPSSSFPLHVRSVPEGVSQVRISPSSADYLIEHTDE